MHKLAIPFAALLVLACSSSSAPEPQRMVDCASVDDAYLDCRSVGTSRVALARQVSEAACVEGRSWGVRDGMLWVDRGCRAEFLVGGPGTSGTSASGGATLVCESSDGRLNRCPAQTMGGVQLVRQRSDSACTFGRTWGWDGSGVWVSEGCRAEFALGSTAPTTSVLCESTAGRRNVCPANTRFGVFLVRQLSDAECVRNRTWGETLEGIWVSEGCRAEFAVRSQ